MVFLRQETLRGHVVHEICGFILHDSAKLDMYKDSSIYMCMVKILSIRTRIFGKN